MYIGAGRDVWSGLGVTMLVGNGVGQSLWMNSTFFVRKLGLGKEVVSLSLVVTGVSRAGRMRWWRQDVGLQISWKKGPWNVITSSVQWFELSVK